MASALRMPMDRTFEFSGGILSRWSLKGLNYDEDDVVEPAQYTASLGNKVPSLIGGTDARQLQRAMFHTLDEAEVLWDAVSDLKLGLILRPALLKLVETSIRHGVNGLRVLCGRLDQEFDNRLHLQVLALLEDKLATKTIIASENPLLRRLSSLKPAQKPDKFTVDEFLSEVLGSQISHGSFVHKIVNHREIQGLNHEFITAEASLGSQTFCIRIDRAGADGRINAQLALNGLPIKRLDTVQMATTRKLLLDPHKKTRQVAVVEFDPPEGVSLMAFALLLESVVENATTYTLFKENCWFFASIVLGILCEIYTHSLEGELGDFAQFSDNTKAIWKSFGEKLGKQRKDLIEYVRQLVKEN